MDRATIEKVAKLLAKAESTNSEPEAIALIEKCYRMLAEVINEYDQRSGDANGPRRRERRHLFDRRRSRTPTAARPNDPVTATARYLRATADETPSSSVIDVSA
jgi:hypothetical protein